jgi:hypothetical protein
MMFCSPEAIDQSPENKDARFVVKWRSKITGHVGQGTARYTFAQCRVVCDQNDVMFKEIEHWPHMVELNPVADVAATAREMGREG